MKKFSIFLLLICFFIPLESTAKKRRIFKRKLSISYVSGYTFHSQKKPGVGVTGDWGKILDGQMDSFFSALEVARNFGRYELGAKIQNLGPAFVTPFVKWNWNKNSSRASIIPALTFGVVPSHAMGVWLRLSLGLSLNRYSAIEPFIGTYAWYKIKDIPNPGNEKIKDISNAKYEKYNFHFNTGLRINLYY